MATKAYLIVGPRYVARRSSMPAALKLARTLERSAQASYGAQAGADCAIIAERADGSLDYRGMACGSQLIGQNFGCAASYLQRAAEALAAGNVREASS